MHRVLIYRGTSNLGDAIQTYALCRLLGGRCFGVYRDGPHSRSRADVPFIVNGWLGWSAPPEDKDCVFAGVHLGEREPEYVAWIRQGRGRAGARDSYSAALLQSSGVDAENIGCATLTLERYRGRRKGRYSIDAARVPGTESLTQSIGRLSWRKQWELACARLDLLRKAEIVYTGRLHVALPCLAFGTPVHFPLSSLRGAFQKQRLMLLGDLGVPFDTDVCADVSQVAARFERFLGAATSVKPVRRPARPEPLS